jgi:hypothetical protein
VPTYSTEPERILRYFIQGIAVVLLSACVQPVNAAPPAELAELFPPGTAAYAELVDPAELAPEIAAVFRGTAFEDSIPLIHAKKDAAKNLIDLNGKRYLALLGLLASPELAGELKKLRIAVGLTGFTDSGDPEVAVVILTHDSPATGLAARAYLTMTPTLRKVGEVGKVPVLQHRMPNINYDNNGVPVINTEQPPAAGSQEPTFAYVPGLFVIGTNQSAVSHAIRRFNGEEKGESLASRPLFKEAATTHRKTGVFFYVDFINFCTKFDLADKARGMNRGIGGLVPGAASDSDFDLLAWFRMTADTKAVKKLAGRLSFRDGGLSATLSASFDPTRRSPLLDLFSGAGVKAELLQHSQGPVSLAIGLTLPEKNRGASVIAFLDGIAKAGGEIGRLPGEAVREIEQKHKLAITEGLLAGIRAVTVFLPVKQELPKGAKAMPVFVLHCENAEKATAWEKFLPILVGELSGAAAVPQTSTETIGDVKVCSLPGTGLPWNSPVHYAQSGTIVAIGLDRKIVARAVHPAVAGSVSPQPADAAAVGLVSIGELLFRAWERPRAAGPVVPRENEEPLILPNGNPLPENFLEDVKKARKGFVESLTAIQPASLTVRRVGTDLNLELFQPKVQAGGLKPVLDAAGNWLDKAGGILGSNSLGRFQNMYDR